MTTARPVSAKNPSSLANHGVIPGALKARTRNPDAGSEYRSGFRVRRHKRVCAHLRRAMAPPRNDGGGTHMISKREFLQVAAATAALVPGDWRRGLAAQRL